ncbi:MAG: hypothetical protein Q7K65_01805 [Candidatus Buchananbacteria bacterium]|nr:hypothetical protein [Candidatus Buchananbacteria bacterium]
MIILEKDCIIGFSKNEAYIIGKSLIDAWGYPYRPEKIKILKERDEYKNVDERFEKENYRIKLKDLATVINALELLYYENIDLESLYDDVSRKEVKILLNNLQKVSPSQNTGKHKSQNFKGGIFI